MRVVNEIIGGDFGAALKIVDSVPIMLIEGISEQSATIVVEALEKAEAEAEILLGGAGDGGDAQRARDLLGWSGSS